MKRHHNMPAAERRAQLALYKDAALLPPAEVPLPEPYGRPINKLGPAQDGFTCSSSSSSSSGGGGGGGTSTCGFASTSRGWMQKHVNQQQGQEQEQERKDSGTPD
ncbi:hypothetical protein K458DRAFT_397699 [Lentithecium fluviatile CBS 122367]|uniref:Uncharacterized protein n=1 Tax=Lentithecium fluviatile CBS 122367 TaxID=1168545 RepID=A0A6G1ICC9_9PLEO|nr:hypothetical protein K458DRAFT_397699 [Lentithecium fluviatile CBS 122367]